MASNEANAGGVLCAAVKYRHGTQAQALSIIDERIRSNTQWVLDEARPTGTLPRAVAMSLAGCTRSPRHANAAMGGAVTAAR